MKKREANFGTLFRHWARANPLRETCHFELKQTQKDSIPFSCVEQQQVNFATAIRESPKGILVRNQGGNGEPDYSYFYQNAVYVVIKFPDMFCIISMRQFVGESHLSKRKSLTSERARQIAIHVEELTKKKISTGRLFPHKKSGLKKRPQV
jgi:hypothetical protein